MTTELPEEPANRKETYLAKMAGQEVALPEKPQSREEQYLEYIAENGGGGGTRGSDFNSLSNRPKYNGEAMTGDTDIPAAAGVVDAFVASGEGAPTTATVGTVGKLYEDTTNGDLYQCTAADADVAEYTWEKVGNDAQSTLYDDVGDNTDGAMTQKAITEKVLGMAKVLTEADYNFNSTTQTATEPYDSVALWLLDSGMYVLGGTNTKVWVHSTTSVSTNGFHETIFLTRKPVDNNRRGDVVQIGTQRIRVYRGIDQHGRNWVGDYYGITYNGLTSTSPYESLSANQGKVLNDKIGGDLSGLDTTDKTSLIAAINELNARLTAIENA